MPSRPLLLTLGDPDGLGPELCLRVLDAGKPVPRALVLLGPEAALLHHCQAARRKPFWTRLPAIDPTVELAPGVYLLEPPGLADFAPQPGTMGEQGGRAAGLSLEAALKLLHAGVAAGLVTCPLNKAMLKAAGFDFPGHTELLARGAGLSPDAVCMCFHTETLVVGLATTHPPLRLVPQVLEADHITRCLLLMHDFLTRLDRRGPIAVAGLNPHAGESGTIGDEEERIIMPAMEAARARGVPCAGPLPGDTVFRRAWEGEFAAVLAMYHDQGLAPLKLVSFGEAVNVTLGLPFVRTSPDHGTGYELVGTGRAVPTGLARALDLALRLTERGC